VKGSGLWSDLWPSSSSSPTRERKSREPEAPREHLRHSSAAFDKDLAVSDLVSKSNLKAHFPQQHRLASESHTSGIGFRV